MADLAHKAMEIWDDLEKDAGVSLRSMSGLLNFGDKDYGGDTPEGMSANPSLSSLTFHRNSYGTQEESRTPKDGV